MKNANLPKVFVIGHHKIATRSIDRLFKIEGYKTIHHHKGQIAATMDKNLRLSKPLLKGIEDYDVYSDMEYLKKNGDFFYGYRLFPTLDLQYPGSLFIYNYRSIDSWLKSQISHKSKSSGLYIRRIRRGLRKTTPELKKVKNKDVVNMWRQMWMQHETEIDRYFAGKSNLLRVNIEDVNSKQKLIESIRSFGFTINSSDLPYVGVTKKKKTAEIRTQKILK